MSFYITTPIYYVNGEPHLGHVYTTVAADVVARHMRQRGEDVFFLTGTDEHGEPVAQAAEREGVPPRELADRNAERFKQVAARVNATNDFFIRTSDPEHAAVVAEVVTRLKDNGHVYEGTYEGWYCPRCADFKTDSELLDGDRCPIHLIVLEREQEDNWFFRLSSFQEPLERLYEENPEWVLPGSRYNEALSFIKGGLQDLSLSRARITWGVPVPWDPSQVVYVWIDALLNYYSALSYAREGEDLTPEFWPADVHLIAKDILKFHGGLLARPAHGRRPAAPRPPLRARLSADGRPQDVQVARERARPVQGDGRLRDGRAALLPAAGGLVRAGRLDLPRGLREPLHHRARQRLRQPRQPHAGHDRALPRRRGPQRRARGRPHRRVRRAGGGRVQRASTASRSARPWTRSGSGCGCLNRYVQDEEPWKLAKDPARSDHLDAVLYGLAEGLRVVSLLLLPYMPETVERLLAALGQEERSIDAASFGADRGGARLGELGQLFPKIDGSERSAA